MAETERTDEDRRRVEECAQRGHAHWKQGNYSAAIEWFSRALSEDPKDAWVLMRRGAARAAIDDVTGAADDLNRAGAMVPGDAGSSQRRWGAAQLGEAIRASIRDAALAPDASAAEVEAMLAKMGASIAAFTEALSENPKDAWAYAHRGAVSMLARWLGARFGVDPARVRRYAESARSDLDRAMGLQDSYAWAMVFQAVLLTVMASNEPDEAARRALFAQATALVEAAGRANEGFPVLRPLTEIAMYNHEWDKAIELGWAQIAKDPDDLITRYCVAWALTRIAEKNDAGDPAVEEARRASAEAFVEQTRKSLLAKRSRICAMLGGLSMLEGRYEAAAAMLDDVLEYPDMDTLVFMQCEPAWAKVREPESGSVSDPRLRSVMDAYARLSPRS
jgi:tetratricopeptide (TPR) repeat protein